MSNKLIGGIYLISDSVTGSCYVGSASINPGILKRWSTHLSLLRKNKHQYSQLQEAWNIDCNRIKFEVLLECSDELLEEQENHFINYIDMVEGFTVINKQRKAVRRSRAKDTSRMKKAQQGTSNPRSKLTNSDVVEIKRLLVEGVPQKEIAEKYGVQQAAISKIKNRTRWSNVS